MIASDNVPALMMTARSTQFSSSRTFSRPVIRGQHIDGLAAYPPDRLSMLA